MRYTVAFLAALLVLLAPAASLATTYRLLELPAMLAATELAFRAVVTDVRTEVLDDEPWTLVTFEPDEILLGPDDDGAGGPDPEADVTLRFLGGTAGGLELNVALMPAFEPGDTVLLLAYAAPYYSPVVGFNQGVWWLAEDGTWLSMDGVPLGLSDQGELQAEAGDATHEEVVAALRAALESR